jgi:hypothetical protein
MTSDFSLVFSLMAVALVMPALPSCDIRLDLYLDLRGIKRS